MQQPAPPFPARLPQRGLGRSRWSFHGTCVKGLRLGDFGPQFWGPGLWQTPKSHRATSKHCSPELLTIRSSCLSNIWYLDAHTLLKRAPTSLTAYLEKMGRRFATCSISSGLGSLHQSDTGSSLCCAFLKCLLQTPCNSICCRPSSPWQKPVPLKAAAFGTQMSRRIITRCFYLSTPLTSGTK